MEVTYGVQIYAPITCNSSEMTVNVNNNSPGSQYYTVGESALVVSWDAFDIEPTVCASTERINNRLTFSLDTKSY